MLESFLTPGKKVLLMILAVLILAGIIWLGFFRGSSYKIQSHEFVGGVEKIDGSTLQMKGNYGLVLSGGEISIQRELSDVQVSVLPGTQFVRVSLQHPSAEELAKTNGVFYPDKLPQTTETVDFKTFQTDWEENNMGVEILTSDDIAGKQAFTAQKIVYKVFAYPSSPEATSSNAPTN